MMPQEHLTAALADVRDRLEKVAGRCAMIQAWHVELGEPWANGPNGK